MVAGWFINDSTPPNDSANENTLKWVATEECPASPTP
jgi:hypothetical protein